MKGVKLMILTDRMDEISRKNAEGYTDLTAYEAIKNAEFEKKREAKFYKLLYTIFDICTLAGFEVQGRITLKDRKTGKIWE